MKYFLHDTNAFQDEKVSELFIKFGYEGVGLFFTILEKLAAQEKPIKTMVLKRQLFVGKKLEKCWSFMEEIGIISSNNGETFNEQLLNFSEKYQIKKEKNKERVSQWRENQSNTENVTHYEHVRNTPKVKVSKVKVSKGNIEATPEEPFFLVMPFDSENFSLAWAQWIEYKKKVHRFTYKEGKYEQIALKELSEMSNSNEQTAILIIQKSIASGYKGLFALKNNQNGSAQTQSGTKSVLNAEAKRRLADKFSSNTGNGEQQH